MRWAAVFLLSGCSSILGIEDFKVADGGTTGDDGSMGFCLGPDGWRVCLPAAPTMPLEITQSFSPPLSTTTSALCASAQPKSWTDARQPQACFLIGSNVTFDAQMVQVTGGRPLVVVAADTITIQQQLDLSSRSNLTGAGAPAATCVAPTPPANSGNGAGGGAGGPFMSRAGRGGQGGGGLSGGVPAMHETSPPDTLRAGCSGGIGGTGQGAGGAPGIGGGAVYLVAGNRIVINGFINVSGSGGQGGGSLAGGGGGGSGGMIVLHAPSISGAGGVLIANGGGGGGGGGGTVNGTAGASPSPAQPNTPAQGGTPNTGGAGYAGGTAAGDGALLGNGGGGGGGGGAGYIRANVSIGQVTASPPVDIR